MAMGSKRAYVTTVGINCGKLLLAVLYEASPKSRAIYDYEVPDLDALRKFAPSDLPFW